ncbi:MAG: TonB-dependent receptor [Sulfurovum sp.]|nr:TonB-dependent receptor [Sulfurovum sp.]
MKKIIYSVTIATLISSPILAEIELAEVLVTSTTKLPQNISKTTANVTVITNEEIEERGYQSVSEALSRIAGFSFASNGGAGQTSSIFIRGLKSDNLLILLDGVALTDYTQPSVASSLEHISIDSIQRIEVVKGAQSGIWGAGAAAGTVNIITKDGIKDKGSIKLKAGSYGTKAIGFTLSKIFGDGSIYIAGNLLDTDSISAILPSDAEQDSYRNKNINIKASLKIGNYGSASLFFHSYNGTYDFDGPSNADDNISKGDSDQKIFTFTYKYKKDTLSVNAKISRRDIKRQLEGSGAWGPWSYDTDGSNTNYSIVSNYDFSPLQSLSVGTEHSINKANTDNGATTSNESFKNTATYANYTHTVDQILGAKTTFNATLRYDRFDKFENKTTYRFGIKRECIAIDGLHGSINIYTGYKAPSLFQFSNSISTLKPESIQGYELSFGYKKLLNISYFSNKIKNKIDSKYDPATFSTSYFNNGDGVKITGVELNGEYSFGESGFVAGASLTHMIDFQDDNGKDMQRIPKNSITVYLDYYFAEDTHIGIVANYAGKRRDLDYSVFPATDTTLDSYTTADLTYSTKLSDNFKLSVAAKNIFDKKYETVKSYSTEGRSIYATIEYRF